MNGRYAKVVKAMTAYDAARSGSLERASAGAALDKAGSKLDERDRIEAVTEYLGSLSKEDLVRLYGPWLSRANRQGLLKRYGSSRASACQKRP